MGKPSDKYELTSFLVDQCRFVLPLDRLDISAKQKKNRTSGDFGFTYKILQKYLEEIGSQITMALMIRSIVSVFILSLPSAISMTM